MPASTTSPTRGFRTWVDLTATTVLVVALLLPPVLTLVDAYQPKTQPPAYVANLTIYELNPRAYTSPNGTGDGSGSGTWTTLAARMPYLADLGITGIWLAGFSLSTSHFYGIWSVYACKEPQSLDPVLGSSEDFRSFIDAAHACGIHVFVDVIGHGLVNSSDTIKQHPDWFKAQGSWGMHDYDYDNQAFLSWWMSVWLAYVKDYGIDGARIDIAEDAWLPIWDNITVAAEAEGHQLTVFGEGHRYHFMQHDRYGFSVDVASETRASPCFETVQLSCHDSGWASPPGNYFAVRGSRARLGYSAIFSPWIPLFLSGEEYDEDPVVDLPLLQQDLYGKSGKPGGWMYGSVRQWQQLEQNESKALMLDDVRLMYRIQREQSDVLHHNQCITHITNMSYRVLGSAGGANGAVSEVAYNLSVPYARFLPDQKAVLVFGNFGLASVQIQVEVPLAAMGFSDQHALYTVTQLYPPEVTPHVMNTSALSALPVIVPGDLVSRGGLAVLLVQPTSGT